MSDEHDTDSDQDRVDEIPTPYVSSESEECMITCGETKTPTKNMRKSTNAGSGDTVRSELSEETSSSERTPCEIDMNQPIVEQSTLFAPVNHTYYYQDPKRDNELVDVFRSLQCYNDIRARQPIVIASGVVMNTNEARDISQPESDYLIQMNEGKILNCYSKAMQSPPQCLMSMSNDADGLIKCDTIPPTILTSDDNNAHAAVIDIEGKQRVVLYATKHILSYTDIMWRYNRAEASQPSTPDKEDNITNGIATFRKTVDRLELKYSEPASDPSPCGNPATGEAKNLKKPQPAAGGSRKFLLKYSEPASAPSPCGNPATGEAKILKKPQPAAV
jgi:hypothetical protein